MGAGRKCTASARREGSQQDRIWGRRVLSGFANGYDGYRRLMGDQDGHCRRVWEGVFGSNQSPKISPY
jgi:hypothetical protein